MKTRVKKFYQDHNHIIIPVTVAAASFAAVAFKINQIVEGQDIVRCARRVHADGAMEVRVDLKNGTTRLFHWNPQT